MKKELIIESRGKKSDLIIIMLMIFICIALFTITHSWFLIVILLLLLFSFILLLQKDKVILFPNNGKAQSTIWTILGKKNYTHSRLDLALAIVFSDISGGGDNPSLEKQYLLFSDGYKLHLPDGKDTRCKIVTWFRGVYGAEIDEREEK